LSGSLEVASTFSPGQRDSRAWASRAHGRRRCSQLSNRIRSCSRSSLLSTVSSRSRPASSGRPSVDPRTWVSSASSLRGLTSTSQTPPGNCRWPSRASSSASLVLPQPPAPNSVTRRLAASRSRSVPSSSWRPTRLLVENGRFWPTTKPSFVHRTYAARRRQRRFTYRGPGLRGWHPCRRSSACSLPADAGDGEEP
jgi:hypothetical protein